MTKRGSSVRDDPSPRGAGVDDTTLGRAARVLFAFTGEDTYVTLAELGRRTGLPSSSLHRLAQSLVATRLLERRGNTYRLGSRLFQLGMRASVERELIAVSTPFLEDLYEQTHETVHLGVRDGAEVVYVLKLGGHRQADTPSRVGGRMPLHCTAIGKALLAAARPEVLESVLRRGLPPSAPRTITAPGVLRRELDTIRAQGIAFEHEESAVGIACCAAPVTDDSGRAVAAISVTGPVGRFVPARHGSELRAAATAISVALTQRAG